ncbi:MAG: hypothetical protein ACXWP5_05635 [Bdellovibrionota bacterium]
MFSRNCWRNEAGATLLMLAALGGMACNDASAMSRGKTASVPAMPVIVDPGPSPEETSVPDLGQTPPVVVVEPQPVAVPPVVVPVPESGTQSDGYALGLKNGAVLVDRLKQRTVDEKGCSAIGDLQQALLAVSKSIRPPANLKDKVVRGFYRGYLDAIRDAIRDARAGCGVSALDDGSFAGSLYGEVICQVDATGSDGLGGLKLEPLYSGWSGGSSDIQSECQASLELALNACANGASEISSLVSEGCSDN